MKLEEAEKIYSELVGIEQLAKHFTKYMVCGSIRRRRPEVNDIDIVAIPKPISEYQFGELSLSDHIRKIAPNNVFNKPPQFPINGDLLKRFYYKDIAIDLYLANEKTFETLVLIRTGSKEHNVRLTTLAQGKGLRLFASGAGLCTFKMVNDKAVPVDVVQNTEDGILQYLLGRIPRPEERNF